MKKFLIGCLSAVAALSAAACSAQSSVPADTTAVVTETTAPAAQISAEAENAKKALEEIAAGKFGGVIYAVQNGKPVATYAGGTLTGNVPITLETPMPVGSVSKQFCAAAILLLQEQGKLSLQDTLDQYFPAYEAGSGISLHIMLCHRSGIPDFPSDMQEYTKFMEHISMDNTDGENTAAFREWLFAQPLRSEPDLLFEYSNFNYTLLGNIVEQVSGMTYIDFLRESFFTPLGMNHTGSVAELKDNPAWAQGFGYEPNELSPGIEPGISKGSGDIISTAADMTVWMDALRSGKSISAESYRAMTTEYSGSHYGYGMYAQIANGAGHFGLIGIFSACDYIDAESDLTIFIATNTAMTDVSNYLYKITSALA